MALERCRSCQSPVSTSAKVCPSCGCAWPAPSTWHLLKLILAGIVFFILYYLFHK